MGFKQFVRTDTNQSRNKGCHHHMVLIIEHEMAKTVALISMKGPSHCRLRTASYIGLPWAS